MNDERENVQGFLISGLDALGWRLRFRGVRQEYNLSVTLKRSKSQPVGWATMYPLKYLNNWDKKNDRFEEAV